MKKSSQVRKKIQVEEVEFSKKSPNPAKAREGKSIKAQKRKEKLTKASTQKALRDRALSRVSDSPESTSSARGKRYTNKKRVANGAPREAPRVKKVYSSAQTVDSVRGVDTGVRPVGTSRGTLRPTGETKKKHLRGGTRTIPTSKVILDETKKSGKKGITSQNKESKKNGGTKKETTRDKKRITPDASDVTPNAHDTTNIDENEEYILPTAAPADQNKNALYPERNPVEGLNRTLKRIIRKGRLLRKDAHPPSIKLTRGICQMIRLGNYPEVSARAFGIQSNTFRTWVTNGFEDIQNGENTPYAKFVLAVDIADAQSEALDVSDINSAIEGWQAKAWIRERKSFQRWGMRALQLSGDINSNLTPIPPSAELSMEPEIAAEVLTALEEAGIVAQSGLEHLSGIAEESPILARNADDTESVELSE